MDADHDLVVLQDAPERIPMIRMHARQPLGRRIVEEADGSASLGCHTLGLGNGGIDVMARQDRQRDEAPRRTAAPFVDVPVVVGAYHGVGQRPVLRIEEEAARECRECGKANRCERAIDIHVLDPFGNLIRALADLAV
ncbi:hypothetical protein D3C72_1635580 [compost metagenome]